MSGSEIRECETVQRDRLRELRHEFDRLEREDHDEVHRQNEIDFAGAVNAELRHQLNEMDAEDAWREEKERQRVENLAAQRLADARKEEEEFQRRVTILKAEGESMWMDTTDRQIEPIDPYEMNRTGSLNDLPSTIQRWSATLEDNTRTQTHSPPPSPEAATAPTTSSSSNRPYEDVLGHKAFINEHGRLIIIVDPREARPLDECCVKQDGKNCSISRCFGMSNG